MKTKYIAHRGFQSRNIENTIEAFEYAASTKAFGIETDVHITKDKQFVCFRDDSTLRLCGKEMVIEQTTLGELQKLKIMGKYKIPTLEEYIKICKSGKKVCVVEIKNPLEHADIELLVNRIKDLGYLDKTIFITFAWQNILQLRRLLPEQEIQFLSLVYDEVMLPVLAREKIDLDIEYTCLTKERIEYCKSLGVKVNCWVIDDEKIAKHFESCGIDYITSNIFQG